MFEYGGKLYKNIVATVNAGSAVRASNFTFRNPPTFCVHSMSCSSDETGRGRRQATAEVEALLDYLFEHPNTAPFFSYRVIQRFTTSNPSPAYVAAVADAFRTGEYGGVSYGAYGSLMATLAATLLHPEARGSAPTNGALREPLLKYVHILRAIEYEDKDGRLLPLEYAEFKTAWDQIPYAMPSVFNFYQPSYQPPRFAKAHDFVAPEFQIFTTPNAVGFLNEMANMFKYGISGCSGGLGNVGNGGSEEDCYQGRARLLDFLPNVSVSYAKHSDNCYCDDHDNSLWNGPKQTNPVMSCFKECLKKKRCVSFTSELLRTESGGRRRGRCHLWTIPCATPCPNPPPAHLPALRNY